MEVAVIEPEGGIVPNDDLSMYDLLITSIDNEAKEREDWKRRQDELHEEARAERGRIRKIDSGHEKIVSDQSAVREARMVFWLCLANLCGSPSLDNLDKARWALRKWRWERLAVSQPIEQAEVQASEEADVLGEPQVFRAYAQNNARKSPVLDGFPYGFPLQQLQPKKKPRRYEKRAKIQAQRRAIEVALVRSRGTVEALEDAYDGLYGTFHRSFDVQLTDEEYLKALKDLFSKQERKPNPQYFCHSQADVNLTFASRRVAKVKTKDDGNKKKNKKKGGKRKGGKRKQ